MFEPKLPAISASIGFLLSFLVGIASGASFLSVLLRALAMGIMFGVFAVVARYLIERFLPELGEGVSSEPDDQGTGGVVDITIGETGKDDAHVDSADSSDFGDMIPDFLAPANRPASDLPTTEYAADSQTVPDFRPSARYDNGVTPSGATQQGASQRQSAATARGNASSAPRQASDRPSEGLGGGSSGDLDVLPDLQDFIPAVRSDEGGEEEDASSGMGGGARISDSLFSAPDTKTSSIESETMAKAIRTILSRDN